MAAVGWVVDRQTRMMRDWLLSAPIASYDGRYAFVNTRHMIRYVYAIDRDALIADLFDKLLRPCTLDSQR